MKKNNLNIAEMKTIAYTSLFAIIIISIISIFFLSSCATPESLTQCSGHDRVIIGYSKNMKWYIVSDDCGVKQISVRIEGEVKPVGTYLIKKDEFRIIHDLK